MIGFGGFVATVGGEGLEVVSAEEEFQGLGEGVGVELAGEVPCEASFERGQDGGGADVVVVGFVGGGEAAVEVCGDFLAGGDADGRG